MTKAQENIERMDDALELYRSGLSLRKVEALTGVGREHIRRSLSRSKELRARLAFHGDPETRYLSRIKKSENGCWLFQGVTNNMGYGMVSVGGRPKLAHRFFYEMKNGPIANGMDACHRCDTPACCNPDHIFIGTRSDNMMDARRKGRTKIGENSPSARFTNSDILAMRDRYRNGETTGQIGVSFNTSYKTVWAIVHRKGWKHL